MSSGQQPQRTEVKNDLGELDRLSKKLAVPEYVADEAARICERDLERGLATGRPLTHAVAASLYAACREKGFPTTLVHVARASGVRRKDMEGESDPNGFKPAPVIS